MSELTNARVWYDPDTGELQITADDPTGQHHGDLQLTHVTLRFEHGHGSSIEAHLKRRDDGD